VALLYPPATTTVLGNATYKHRHMHGQLTEIRYASSEGANAQDGLTWGTAKKDILGAYDALPAAGGKIFYAGGTYADSVNTDRGLWIVGPNSANYASPPTGWRQQKQLTLIGVGSDYQANMHAGGAGLAGGSGTDLLKPTLWISGTNVPLEFQNVIMQFPAVAIRIGVETGGTGTTNTSGIVFRRCGYQLNQVAGNGPGIELGYAYWLYFYDCTLSGNTAAYTITAASITAGTTARFTIGTHSLVVGDTVYVSGVTPAGYNGNWTVTAIAATTFDANIGTSPGAGSIFGTAKPTRHYRRAAIAHDTVDRLSGTASGLIHIDNCIFNGGGFHYMPNGAGASGNIVIRNITHEGDFGGQPQPPTLHVRAAYGAAAMPAPLHAVQVENVELADGNFVDGAVLVDGLGTNEKAVVVHSADLRGNGTLIGQNAADGYRGRQTVINARGVWGHSASAARTFGAAGVPYINLAPQDASTWGSAIGNAVVTTGKPAPDGTALAARLNHASDEQRQIYRAGATFAIGDWVIAGVWRRAQTTSGYLDQNFPIISSVGGGAITFEGGSSDFVLNTPLPGYIDDGGWCWFAAGGKAISGGGGGELILSLRVAAGCAIDYYAPVLIQVAAASVVDDDDMRDFIRYFRTFPNQAPAGSISTLLGQKLIARGGLGIGNSAAATTPGSVVKKMEVFSETGASLGFIPIYNSIT